MRKLLNTLYVLSADSWLSLENENVVIFHAGKKTAQIPLHTLEGIICFCYKGASPALMGACAEKGVNLCFFSPQGRFLAKTMGKEHGNVLLRITHHKISNSEEESCKIARGFILGKVFNAKWVLERMTRDHGICVPIDKFKSISRKMSVAIKNIRECSDMEQLRGIEGETAQLYFSCFNDMILQQKNSFVFEGRNRRPPLDNVNALLSFSYSILANECVGALETVGLDPYIGFMHRPRPGRNSLALDLMEELRPVLADRFVLYCINQKVIRVEHFEKQESGAVQLTEEGKRTFLRAWQERKQEQLTHPYLHEKIEWGLVAYVQALLLARMLRGDLEEYPPFLWK